MANTDFRLQFQGESLKMYKTYLKGMDNPKISRNNMLVTLNWIKKFLIRKKKIIESGYCSWKNIFYIVLEFEDDEGFIERNQGATTVTIDDPIKSRKQRKAIGTDFEEEDNDDKTEVSGTQSQ